MKGTIWRPAVQILKRRRLHGADRMDAADTAAEHGKADKIEVTWAVTALDPAKRLRIGKIWAPEGKKWLVADGVKRQAYVFELMRYPDLEAFSVDLESRMLAGVFALVAGRLKRLPGLDPLQAHPRSGGNFADDPSWLFQLDFDGLAAANSRRIDRPEDFGAVALHEALRRLPAAFEKVDCVVYATSSSGLPFNAKGEPANGRARFRVVFWLSRPVTFAEQGLFTQALKQLPGLDCLDESIFVLPQFSFVARPKFPNGMADPIETPVMMHKGDRRCLDVDILLTEIDVEPASKGRSGTRGTPARAEDRRLDVAPELRVPLMRRAVAAIVNDLNRIDWVHFAHAIDGALDRDPAGRDIFLEFSARWEAEADPYEDFDQVGEADQPEGWEEPDPEEEAERVWDTLGEGRAGFGYLLQLLTKQNTPEAEAALATIQLERARVAFPDPPPEDPEDEDDDDAPPDDPPVDLWKALDTPELPVGLLPERVERFVRANAKALGADSAGLVGASLAALAAAIPDSVKLQVQTRGRKWLIAARIWIALVGDPSTKKTPIIDAALAALRAKDLDRRRRYAALKAMWDALSKKEKAEALAAGRGPPDHNRLIISDTTAEAAGEILMTSPNGVLGVYDELSGWFGQMERYGQESSERGFWLQARNGGPHSIDRIVRGSNYIPNLSIALVGGIQPEPMRKVAGNSSDDGLIQRLTPIMLHPAELTDDEVDTEEADKDFTSLIEALLDLTPTIRPLKFDEGAQKIRRELENEHHERARSWEPINKKISSAFGKQDGYFAELCVIWHCAENAGQDSLPGVVTEDTTRRAAEFMRTFLRPHLIAFYAGLLDLSDEHDRLKAIAGYILTHKPKRMNSREVQKAVRSMRKLGARDVTWIMEQLEAFGWLFRHPPPRHGALPVWKINPAVHVQFAEQAKEEAARRARDRATILKDAAARSVDK